MRLTVKKKLADIAAAFAIKTVAFSSVAVILLIFVFTFREALPLLGGTGGGGGKTETLKSETYGDEGLSAADHALQKRIEAMQEAEEAKQRGEPGLGSLAGAEWNPVSTEPKYGIWPLFYGSLKISLIALLIAAPVAILAALFSAVFAPRRLRELIKPVVELLAGFPSVVIGFFALTTIAGLLQWLFGYHFRLNAFVGGMALALAVIPIIYTVAEDALNSVPRAYTEASLALGANPWQTALFVILPSATPGIFAAMLLGFGRAFGETMIVLMATGNAAIVNWNIFEPVRTISATIGAEMAEVVFGDVHYSVLFLLGSLLFLFTFTLNGIAEFWVRGKLMKRFRGGA